MTNAWSDLIQPDDPRYESWLLISAFLQGEDSGARAEFLRNCQKKGEIQQNHVLKLVERIFDSYVKGIVVTVNGTAAAEPRARDLDELLESFLGHWKEWFLAVERLIRLAVGDLNAQARLRLTTRCHAWKEQLFQFALDSEIARIKKRGVKSDPGAGCDIVISPGGPRQRSDGPIQRWEDIEIRFLGDERVQIFICGTPGESKNFAEMGFEDRRGNGGKPNRAWLVLRALAKNDGIIPAAAISGQQNIQKRAQAIRHLLCHHFHMTENPLPFVEGTGYKTRFKITRSPACET